MIERRADSVVALPGYPGVRLFPDSVRALLGGSHRRFGRVAHYSPKRRVSAAALPFSESASPLRSLYVLGPPLRAARPAVVIVSRTPRQAMMDVLRYVLYLDVRDRTRARQAFDLAGAVVDRATVRSIRCSWNLSRLDEIREAVAGDVMANS
jgi:hypothetical protein